MVAKTVSFCVGAIPRAVSFSDKSFSCRGGAPVPALRVHGFVTVSEIGAATGGGPYKRMKQPWGNPPVVAL